MDKLNVELTRLYLLDGQLCRVSAGDAQVLTPALLQRHLDGEENVALDLVSPLDEVRALLIVFRSPSADRRAAHWEALCALANDMQQRLGLPAPAVSISGDDGYGVWLSLAAPVPRADAERLLRALKDDCLAELPDAELALFPGAAHGSLVALPPCLHAASGRWAAWINPGMGAAFAEEPGLDMPPPPAAQAQFLAGLDSITPAQLAQALALLAPAGAESLPGAQPLPVSTALALAPPAFPAAPAPALASQRAANGLLLKDASLEDIVAWLHARGIEPTLRHTLPK